MLRSPNTLPSFSAVASSSDGIIIGLALEGSERHPTPTGAFGAIACPITTACRVAGLGRTTIYELLAEGEISAIKVGRRTLVKLGSLQEFLARQPDFKSQRQRQNAEARSGLAGKGDRS